MKPEELIKELKIKYSEYAKEHEVTSRKLCNNTVIISIGLKEIRISDLQEPILYNWAIKILNNSGIEYFITFNRDKNTLDIFLH
ncbi:MAG: hypothetical protein R6U36_11275 [Candidatus Fermentibacteraceae bacterium]